LDLARDGLTIRTRHCPRHVSHAAKYALRQVPHMYLVRNPVQGVGLARRGAMASSAVRRFVPRFLRLLGRSRGGLPPLAGQKDRELPTLRGPRARPSGRSRGATRRGYPTSLQRMLATRYASLIPRYMSRPGVSALALPQRRSDGQRRGSTGAKGTTHVECLAVVFPILWCST